MGCGQCPKRKAFSLALNDCCHQLSRLSELALPLSHLRTEGQSSVLQGHPPAGRASLDHQTYPLSCTGRISRLTRCPLESPEGRRKTPSSKYSRWWLEPTSLLDKSWLYPPLRSMKRAHYYLGPACCLVVYILLYLTLRKAPSSNILDGDYLHLPAGWM